ncbi:MAG: DoxX family protein [Imperialibacter sp.]|uniref:DoxX family protein n=1 Tax=Imperialibacter sp. TaxID=2038411 RepID=UPI003A8BCBE2
MKGFKIGYWIALVLFSAFMLMSAFNFLFNTDVTATLFKSLGFPSFIIIPLGVAKILGVIAIASRYSEKLKEWALVGFFFDFSMAIYSHINANDGMFMMPVLALIMLLAVFFFEKKAFEAA